ncbi:MAG: phage terminase large subunit [Brevinema sp.]
MEKDNKFYIMDIFRDRLLFPDLKRKVLELYERYRPKELVIENKSSGMALIQQLEQEHQIYPIKYEPKLSKKDRIMTNSGVLESGRILLPRGASFLDALRVEVVTFPNGKHDPVPLGMTNWMLYPRYWIGRRIGLLMERHVLLDL